MHNILLSRDASQQAMTGLLVDELGEFDKLEAGDLVFFGERATAEQPKERVVNSFDPSDELYDEFNTNRYLRTKRILGEDGFKSVDSVFVCD